MKPDLATKAYEARNRKCLRDEYGAIYCPSSDGKRVYMISATSGLCNCPATGICYHQILVFGAYAPILAFRLYSDDNAIAHGIASTVMVNAVADHYAELIAALPARLKRVVKVEHEAAIARCMPRYETKYSADGLVAGMKAAAREYNGISI